ncbi:MAG: 3-hydroxyacyl-ACP dehydratase [Ferruginibacter sp.]
MILENDFYTISSLTDENGLLNAVLQLNAGHRIFEGHFPGQPVTPGVCMLQMVKELLEKQTGSAARLIIALEMKFLLMIDPRVNGLIRATLQYAVDETGKAGVTASLSSEAGVHFKFKGSFQLEAN